MRAEWIDFYDAHFTRVVRFLMHRGASLDVARDAAQEAFTESWDLMHRDPAQWQGTEAKHAWIRTVAWRRFMRPPGSRAHVQGADIDVPDQPDFGPGPEELAVQARMVLDALQALDEVPRAVMAFAMDGTPTSDIAQELDMTQQQVRDMKKKGRAILKRELSMHRESRGGKS